MAQAGGAGAGAGANLNPSEDQDRIKITKLFIEACQNKASAMNILKNKESWEQFSKETTIYSFTVLSDSKAFPNGVVSCPLANIIEAHIKDQEIAKLALETKEIKEIIEKLPVDRSRKIIRALEQALPSRSTHLNAHRLR